VVNAVFARLARSAVADIHSSERLHLKREMLDNVPSPSAFFNTAQKSAVFLITAPVRDERRHQFLHSLIKTFEFIGRFVLVILNIEPHYNQLFPVTAPIIRSAQCSYFENFHIS